MLSSGAKKVTVTIPFAVDYLSKVRSDIRIKSSKKPIAADYRLALFTRSWRPRATLTPVLVLTYRHLD